MPPLLRRADFAITPPFCTCCHYAISRRQPLLRCHDMPPAL